MDDFKYTIAHEGGRTILICNYCGHRVPVSDFDGSNGNPRTQAATAINTHISGTHWGEQVVRHQRAMEAEALLHPNYLIGSTARNPWPSGGGKVRG